ncbi:MAG: rhodanese-like domain-containing protein [Gemmatimonadota bacterium]
MFGSTTVPEITVKELHERVVKGDIPQLVDVREHFERRVADLPDFGQLHLPAGELLHRMGELDREREIILYCRTGSRSAWAVRYLRHHGFENVTNLRGGVMAWRRDVDPSLRAY